jgi:hypothetical protein
MTTYRMSLILAGSISLDSTFNCKESPGGLGETWARVMLPCLAEEDAGLYECRAEGGGKHTSVSTKVNEHAEDP